MIGKHYSGNTTDFDHGSGSHPNEDIKVFKKYRVSDHLLSMVSTMRVTFTGIFTEADWADEARKRPKRPTEETEARSLQCRKLWVRILFKNEKIRGFGI